MSERITAGVWRVGGDTWGLEDLPSLSVGCNVYLFRLDGACVMVDCGVNESRDQIEIHLRAAAVQPDELTDLILTHSHYDHTFGTHEWQSRYALQTHFNSVGVEFLERRDLRLVGHHILGPEAVFAPFRVDHAVQDGETFRLGKTAITTYHLPGHSPDSTLFVFDLAGTRIGICGDITFAPKKKGVGEIGWLSLLWLSNLQKYQASLQYFRTLSLDFLLPGHGHVIAGSEAIQEVVSLSLATVDRLLTNPDVRHFGIA